MTEAVADNFLNKNRFTRLVEDTVIELKVPYMEAILHLCDQNDIEYTKSYVSNIRII